ncbi:MAG: exodeoxyribonuclease VII small subunit, partial [Clostridiales bacterium]|nr:exodeoxyribonuclease VII small subunit [Clostridiales bacterium]
MTLETALDRLNEIAGIMESDSIGLSESVALYEEGTKLLSVCTELLSTAEAQVMLARDSGTSVILERFVCSEKGT